MIPFFIIFLISSQYFKKICISRKEIFSLMVDAALSPNSSNVTGTTLKYLGWQLYPSSHIPSCHNVQGGMLNCNTHPCHCKEFSSQETPTQIKSIHNIFLPIPWYQAEFILKHLPEGMVSDISQSSPLLSASCFSEVSSDTINPGFGAKIAEVTTALCASERQSNFDYLVSRICSFYKNSRHKF